MIARLLKARDVARFIVAPDGYGKTFLAIEYAETMFSWAHTFWVNARSPCFIRDLDDASIASSCISLDEEVGLVVFDDVPPLDGMRMEVFSQQIDDLIAHGAEVVVTCTPISDMAGPYQLDRIRLGSRDLLLDDGELDDARSNNEKMRRPADTVGPADRIPALVWADGDDAPHAFAKQTLYEEMPSDLLFVAASALVLRRGSLEDLLASASIGKDVLVEFLEDYPHLGFDDELDRFETSPLPMEALAGPLRKRMPELVARSHHDSAEKLAYAWADALIGLHQAGRACDVIREICPRGKRATWLVDNAYELVAQACFFPSVRLAGDQGSCKGATRKRLGAIEALCLFVLGDEEGSLKSAKRYAFDASAPIDVRISCLLVAARLATGSFADTIRRALEAEAEAEANADAEADADAPASGGALRQVDWAFLAQAWCVAAKGPDDLARLWSEYRAGGGGRSELCICASWMFSLLEGGEQGASVHAGYGEIEFYIRGLIAEFRDQGLDYFIASAALSMEEAHVRGVQYVGGVLETSSLLQLRRVELDVLSQRRLFEESTHRDRLRRNDWISTHPAMMFNEDEERLAPRTARSVPILMLRMFGRFEVTIGGTPIDQKRFNRQNSRTLLVLLAVNQGRELSRDALTRSMWPQSAEEVARKNFYTVWSNLRSALTLPDGTCPYLLRHQYGCSLESRYVHSDVERLDEICRELLFGAPNVEQWSALFAEIDRDYSSDLMPAEYKNRLVIQARNEYRTRLVDALVAATFSVIQTDNPQWGIWFARSALDHDDTREDAYVALMRAQIAGNQRTAAMMTYLKCRRVLSDKLGIDPSPETTLLYESLLDSA